MAKFTPRVQDEGRDDGVAHHQYKRNAMHPSDIGNLNERQPQKLQKAQVPREDTRV